MANFAKSSKSTSKAAIVASCLLLLTGVIDVASSAESVAVKPQSSYIEEIFNGSDTITGKELNKMIDTIRDQVHDSHHDHDHRHSVEGCFHLTALSSESQQRHSTDVDDAKIISRKEFESSASTPLVWLALGLEPHECYHAHDQDDHDSTNSTTVDSTNSTTVQPEKCEKLLEKYLLGSTTLLVTWFLSLMSCVLIGRLGSSKVRVLMALRGLGIGTLLGDALLHMIPEVMGEGHDHGAGGHDNHDDHAGHDHGRHGFEGKGLKDPIWKMTATVTTIFILWIIELSVKGGSGGHGHSHGVVSPTNNEVELGPDGKKMEMDVETKMSTSGYLKNIQPQGWIAFLGDILHKLADGFAIGASFSSSITLGMTTALALFFHEIPHELGDYSILYSAGFKHLHILALNSFTSAFSLVSFFIIATIGSGDPLIREYVFAATIGVFIYISTASMMPRMKAELNEIKDTSESRKMKLIVVFCFIAGWVMMTLIGVYEDAIELPFEFDKC